MHITKLVTVAAMALLVFGWANVTAASAEWFVEGTALAGTAALATTAAVTQNPKLTVAGVSVECTSANLSMVKPEVASRDQLSASSLTFGGCKSITGSCSESPSTITTVPILTTELVSEGTLEDVATIAPSTGKIFATLRYEGETCALAGVQPLKGKITADLPKGQEASKQQPFVFASGAGGLELGSAAAELSGEVGLKLASSKNLAARVEFRAEDPADKNISLLISLVGGKDLEFTQASAASMIKCSNLEIKASENLTKPTPLILLELTYPAGGCTGKYVGEAIEELIVACPRLEIASGRYLVIPMSCEFTFTTSKLKPAQCKIDYVPQFGGVVNYVNSKVAPKDITAEVRAPKANYHTSAGCKQANGEGKVEGPLIIKGSEVLEVGVEVS